MTDLQSCNAAGNRFRGPLPRVGPNRTSRVVTILFHNNHMEGHISEEAICRLPYLSDFWIHVNGFRGTLPENGLRAMTKLRGFGIHFNLLAGALPEDGLRAMNSSHFCFVLAFN
eukprot:4458963-Amphidinium_carterae.1